MNSFGKWVRAEMSGRGLNRMSLATLEIMDGHDEILWARPRPSSPYPGTFSSSSSSSYIVLTKDDQLNILLTQISNNEFGLKGTCFTITYGFVGNVRPII